MKGFFSAKETKSKSYVGGVHLSCASCGLSLSNDRINKESEGNGDKEILIVLGVYSNKHGHRQIRMIKQVLSSFGIDLYEDCVVIYSVACCADKLLPIQVDCCRKNVIAYIEKMKPRIIIPFGWEALRSVLGPDSIKTVGPKSMSLWRGLKIPDQSLMTFICPVECPLTLYPDNVVQEVIWKKDIENALSCKKVKKAKTPNVQIIQNLSVLNEITSKLISIDYETTGLKPHASGHRIVAASVAYTENECFSFLMPQTRKERKPFLELLRNNTIKKMAHNMKFEEAWSVEKLKQPVQGWVWDSMIAAHILDNRSGICGLKFQTYITLGITDYSTTISPYLQASDKDSNSLNNIFQCLDNGTLQKELLTYCGLDTIYQYRLSNIQMKQIEPLWKLR